MTAVLVGILLALLLLPALGPAEHHGDPEDEGRLL